MTIDGAYLDGGSWPLPYGTPANDHTAPVKLAGTGKERWRVRLARPGRRISVAASGRCFVAGGIGITAMDGPAVQWTADTCALSGCMPLRDGLLVTCEMDMGLVVRDQHTGKVVSTTRIPERPYYQPVPLSNGLLAFMTWQDGRHVLHATSLTGKTRWEHPLRGLPPYSLLVRADQVIVDDEATLRAFDADGGPAWTIDLHDVSTARDPDGARLESLETCEVESPLIGMPGGDILVAIRGDMIGYLLVDGRQGDVRMLPAHLPPNHLAVPLRDGERELLVLPGWPEPVTHLTNYASLTRLTVIVVDVGTGTEVLRHDVPETPGSIVADSRGLVAVAGSPTPERWAKYHHAPSYNLEDRCYIHFLDNSGVRGEWRPGRPFGTVAVGAHGDLLVSVGDELVSIG